MYANCPFDNASAHRDTAGMELSAVTAIASALNDAGVRYLVVGGLAVNAHGYVRMTMDVDLVRP